MVAACMQRLASPSSCWLSPLLACVSSRSARVTAILVTLLVSRIAAAAALPGACLLSIVGCLPDNLAALIANPSALSLGLVYPDTVTTNAAAVAQARQLQTALATNREVTLDNLFITWAVTYAQHYTSISQASDAFAAFTDAVYRLLAINLVVSTGWWSGFNQFSALTLPELDTFLKTQVVVRSRTKGRRLSSHCVLDTSTPPSFVNWTATGRTTPVKNQGSCGSCWANSGMTVMEAAVAISYPDSTPTPFSRQVVIACANSDVNPTFASYGCGGGAADDAMGLTAIYTAPLESVYPYEDATGTCNQSMLSLPTAADNWFQAAGGSARYQWQQDQGVYGYDNVIYVPTQSETALRQAVSILPVAFYWSVGQSWYSYAGGIYTGADCSSSINHGMLFIPPFLPSLPWCLRVAVGYDSAKGFWILLNSWDVTWGVNGFAQVAMTGDGAGVCQMYMMSYTFVPSSISGSADDDVPPPPRTPLAKSPPPPPSPSPPTPTTSPPPPAPIS